MKRTTILALLGVIFGVFEGVNAQNDKQVIGDAVFTVSEISQGVEVLFLVRFENLNPDTAFNVVIRDTLDPRFDANTLRMIDASHGYQLLRDQGFVRWYFNGIRLPGYDPDFGYDNATGYVMYAVEPYRFLGPGQTIQNRACISFDNNTICTNDATVWIDGNSGTADPADDERLYRVVPNPNYGQFGVKAQQFGVEENGKPIEWWITDMNGKVVNEGAVADAEAMPNEISLERPAPGLYLLWVKDSNRFQVEQFAVIR